MIEQLNIRKIPNVDGVPGEGQHSISWIKNGECLSAATTETGHEGTLNRAPYAIQENIVRLDENSKTTVTKVNEVVTAVNDIKTTLGAVADGSIIDIVNQTIAKVESVEENLGETSRTLQTTVDELAETGKKIGVRPAADPSTRTIYDDISFIKQELGAFPNFNINGYPDPGSSGSGIKYRVIQNTEALNNHGQRIRQLENDWQDSDVGELTKQVNKMRSELGDPSLATQDNVYLRLRTNTRNIASISNEVQEVKKAILFESIPDIGTKVTKLQSDYTQLNDEVNGVDAGIRPRLTRLENKIGNPQSAGSIDYRLTNQEREFVDLKSIVGFSGADGLRGEVARITNTVGTDNERHTIAGRLKIVENTQGRLEANVQDIEQMIGNRDSGLIAGVIKLSSDMYGNPEGSTQFEQDGIVKTVKALSTSNESKVTDVPDDGFHYLRKHGEWVQVAWAAGAFKNTTQIDLTLDEQDQYKGIPLTDMTAEVPVRGLVKSESLVTVNDKGLFRCVFRCSVHAAHNATFVVGIAKNGQIVHEVRNGHYGTDELISYSTSAFLNIEKGDRIDIRIKGVSVEALAQPLQIKEFLFGISPV
ncbi:fibritin [Escherichia virus KFS-EC]|uniref:Fibritin n=1 Tax=Escherichia virus KFS-EC TaxID=2250214 RepID=A0A345BRW4_9CAUD|nr:fibritin neck whisker [Escherichia virus KFS-EC]AXF53185.1 fibritin [Escherichia virus KFS-EC]